MGIHDWGAWIGYQMMYQYPELMNRTVAFDIPPSCETCTTNLTYREKARQAWMVKDSEISIEQAKYWEAPCPECAVWRTTWPYVKALAFRGLTIAPNLGPPKPLLFLWGGLQFGKPRTAENLFSIR